MEKSLLSLCYKAMDSKMAEDIKIIDLRSVNPYIDYFVIGSANNDRKANAIIDEIYDAVEKEGYQTRIVHNSKESGWYLADLDTVVCHVFVGDVREKYNLEGLWKDLPLITM